MLLRVGDDPACRFHRPVDLLLSIICDCLGSVRNVIPLKDIWEEKVLELAGQIFLTMPN